MFPLSSHAMIGLVFGKRTEVCSGHEHAPSCISGFQTNCFPRDEA